MENKAYLITNDRNIFTAASRAFIIAMHTFEYADIKTKIIPFQWYDEIDTITKAWQLLQYVKEE